MASTSYTYQADNLSPWADRFAPYDQRWAIGEDGRGHSLLAPLFPRLHPRLQYDVPAFDQPLPKPNDEQIDLTFFTERVQHTIMQGTKSRQLGVLNTGTFIGQSGHTESDDSLGGIAISIDETKWLDCMQRNRWYKPWVIPNMVPLNHTQELTIDDDDLWAYVRWPFELVNRILTQLITEQHPFLHAVLFGDVLVEEQEGTAAAGQIRRLLNPGENLPRFTDNKRIFVNYQPLDQRPTSIVFWSTVREMTRNVVWSFSHEEDGKNISYACGATSLLHTDSPLNSHGPILITISVRYIRGLLERTGTHTEACYAYLGMAVTIFHELMHAMWMQRFLKDYPAIEPFIDRDEMCELGCASENAIFGGRFNVIEGSLLRLDGAFHGLHLGVTIADWPNPWDVKSYSGTNNGSQKRTTYDGAHVLSEGAQQFVWHIPALWISYLFTEEFWHDSVAKYGSKAFKPPKMILGYAEYWRGSRRAFGLHIGEPKAEIPQITTRLQALRKRFLDREEYYTTTRPWQIAEYKKWEATPWSWTAARTCINEYATNHGQRNFKKAATNAEQLFYASKAANSNDRDNDPNSLPCSPTYWIFFILSGMMYAALPISKEPAEVFELKGMILKPTKHAITGHPAKSASILKGESKLSNQEVPRQPTLQPEFIVEPPIDFQTINHPLDYLDLVDFYMFYMKTSHMAVDLSWLRAVHLALREIRDCRASDNSTNSWANWNFRIPNYSSSNNWVNWSDETQHWKWYTGSRDSIYKGFYPSPLAPINQIMSHPPPTATTSMSEPMPMPIMGPSTTPITCLPPVSGPPAAPALSSTRKSPFLRYKYFTIASVADNGWIVDANQDDGTTDVYDLQALLDVLDDGDLHFGKVTECSDKGRRLLPNQEKLRDELRSPRLRFHVGKLLQMYRIHEVAEFNGKNDMPSWVIFDNKIFDITEYTASDHEQQKWLEGSAGGPTRAETADEIELMKEILRGIREYQIGLVMPQNENPVPGQANYLMTKSMLRKYDNPSDGVFTAIHGSVYNITGYVDFHPGGSQILNQVAGRDGTEIFLDYHPVGYINHPDFAVLKVGRLIEERARGDIHSGEIALHDFVFSASNLYDEGSYWQKLLMPFHGSDLTHILTSRKQEDSELVNVLTNSYLEHKQHIVARFPLHRVLREVTLSEVKQCNLSKNTAWVVVGENVFDVTPLLIHPSYYDNNPGLVLRNAGKVIDCPATALWLNRVHSHRIIAKLTYHSQDLASSINTYSHQGLGNADKHGGYMHDIGHKAIVGETQTRKRHRSTVEEDWARPNSKRRYSCREW